MTAFALKSYAPQDTPHASPVTSTKRQFQSRFDSRTMGIGSLFIVNNETESLCALKHWGATVGHVSVLEKVFASHRASVKHNLYADVLTTEGKQYCFHITRGEITVRPFPVTPFHLPDCCYVWSTVGKYGPHSVGPLSNPEYTGNLFWRTVVKTHGTVSLYRPVTPRYPVQSLVTDFFFFAISTSRRARRKRNP